MLAAELAEPVSRVLAEMQRLATSLTRQRIDMRSVMTFDQALAAGGRAVAAGALRGPSRPLLRPRFVRVLRVPANLIATSGYCGTANGPTGPDANYAPPGTPGFYQPEPSVQCVWIVVLGNTPSEIAYWITGSGGVARVRELLDANPDKTRTGTPGTPSYNFASLVPGEKLKLPKAWNQFMARHPTRNVLVWGSRGGVYPVGPTPAAPPPSASDFANDLPPGAITAAKVRLGTWGRAEKVAGWAYPGQFDLNDTLDEAFRAAVRAFQLWSVGRGATLRTDGAFDEPTATALATYMPSSVPVPDVKLPPVDGKLPPVDDKLPLPPVDGKLPPVLTPPAQKDTGDSAAPLLLLGLAAVAFGALK